MAAKIYRINYKSDFIMSLHSDAGWTTPFCIKFWTGAPSLAYFVGWDGTTYTHCTYDPNEPTELVVQFDDHHLPIGDLKYQVAYHFTVADFPDNTEDEVINPGNITTEIDGETYQVMLDFTGETAPEIQFALPAYANELQRIINEQQRIADEQTRINNEETRISNEQTRLDNEAQRIRNEQTRISQEEARVREFATLKQESQEATTAANNAAALANQKAQLAADKAQLADDKAALAQDAATLANEKAQLAADKAELANNAAQLADDKAALAQQKADYAQAQGDYAKQEGDAAQEILSQYGTYIENPDFLRVFTDHEGKILWAIKSDGSIYYGVGCPKQIEDYIRAQIDALGLDEYDDIVTFLGDLINGDTLSTLLNGKVDKIAGKGLSTNDFTDSDKEVVDSLSIIESPEYIGALVDHEGKLLGYITPSGKKVFNIDVFFNRRVVVGGVDISPTAIEEMIENAQKSMYDGKVLIVDAAGYGDFTTIEDALANAGDSASKHVTIIVLPGVYTPAPRLPDSNPYAMADRNISLIGLDRDACILKGNVGYYDYTQSIDYSILRLNGNVLVKNFTFIHTCENYESVATEHGWDLEGKHARAYCFHADDHRRGGDITAIENCKMYNDHFTCIGWGLRANSTLRIKDCEVESDVNATNEAKSGFSSYGTLYGHMSSSSLSMPNQRLEILNCLVKNNNYDYGIYEMMSSTAQDLSGTSSTLLLVRNIIKTANMTNAFKRIVVSGQPQINALDSLCFGNNVEDMNVSQ